MMVMMETYKIFYEENKQSCIATGEIISEDEHFITINDRYDGKIEIGKRFITKKKKVNEVK